MAAPTGSGSGFTTTTSSGKNYGMALYSLMVLFFMMGFITCLNDILVPYLKILFKLDYTQVNMINLCFFGAYFVMSIPGGKLVQRYGYKPIMIAGFMIAALGASMFYPAASMRTYPMFLAALFVLATGITLLQVSGNPYVAVLGSPESSSSRLTLTQALNSLGTTIAPLIGTYLILSKLPELPIELKQQSDFTNLSADLQTKLDTILANTNVSYLQYTYMGIAAILVLIGLVLFVLKLPAIGHGEGEIDTEGLAVKSSIFQYRHLILGSIGIFVYVGAEVAIGSHIINYLGMKEVMNWDAKTAGDYVTYYWGSAMIGRFLGTFILTQFNPGKVLAVFAFGAIGFIVISIFSTGAVSMWTLLLVGFCNSLMFPTIFTLSIKGLGKYTDQASGILCTAIVGGALIPLAFGFIADKTGGNLKLALVLPILCYLYISFFGLSGHKIKK